MKILLLLVAPFITAYLMSLWPKYAKPKSRNGLLIGSAVVFLMACAPAGVLIASLGDGQILCMGRRCDPVSLSSSPFTYWLTFVLWYLVCLFFLSIALYGFKTAIAWQQKSH
ncbi:hypothetical protein [Luteimonas cucumeris]|uniref:hypothetical protein n=1 Tax=Luteimonas cucumeris TaxID=985012 RepID=UPI0011A4DAEC|nr:hypothetical protein [Luteimonas cucumeris]